MVLNTDRHSPVRPDYSQETEEPAPEDAGKHVSVALRNPDNLNITPFADAVQKEVIHVISK